MDPEHDRWTQVREELARIQDASPSARPELIASLDEPLRSEVASLLAAMEHAPAFLRVDDAHHEPGASLGPYMLVDEIGRGGMGVVYRAERRDREFTQQVAIKVAGGRLFGPDVERRFIQERQILAQLDHPHIVRLLDGGVTGGRRYFVMELVNGTPLTEYCTAGARPLRQRLDLFRNVCEAIHYAHQRLILHRDLKPANVIVTADGVVKVLDFGIAQIVHGDGAAPDASTMLHPFSLVCASPEQLRGEPLSLASDVYSLGVLLYELVTGQNPQHRPGDSFDETYRRVVESGLPAPGMSADVPSDLDAIVLKAVARLPSDRYASVSELQADVERWLDGRPVLARAPSRLYVLRKLVRRHKALSAMIAALVAILTIGAVVFVRQSRIEQRRFEDARRLINAVVQEIQPKLESIPATLPLRQVLIERTMTYLESVSRDAGNNVELLRELANAYAQLATIQGDALAANLGDRRKASRFFEQAAALMDRALALAPGDPGVLIDASTLNRRRSDFALQSENRDDARRFAAAAIDLAERSLALVPDDVAPREARALAQFSHGRALLNSDPEAALGWFDRVRAHFAGAGVVPAREAGLIELYTADVLIKRGDKDRAPRYAREALRIANQILAARPNDQTAQLDAALAAAQLASILYNSGDEEGSVEHFRASAEIRERIVAADPDNVRARERLALAKGRLGTILARAGDYPGARTMLDRSVSLYEGLQAAGQLAPTMEADFAEVLGHTGDYYQRTKDVKGACAAFSRAAALLQAANARAPLTAFRKEMLEFNLKELERCR